MAPSNTPLHFINVNVRAMQADGSCGELNHTATLQVEAEGQIFKMKLIDGVTGTTLHQSLMNKSTRGFPLGNQAFVLKIEPQAVMIIFSCQTDLHRFSGIFDETNGDTSAFDKRTDEASGLQYFAFYGNLARQQSMLEDKVRTSTYQKSMLENASEFAGKVVLDVGAGTGILSYFAVQAGAKKVYAVEASNMAQYAQVLAKNNNACDKIEVVAGRIEDITLPENVDIIVSEPMGYMLFNERMLETYLHAKKWLKEGGNMYPTTGTLYVAPFSDDNLFNERVGKSEFWSDTSFYGVNLTSLKKAAREEYFKRPQVAAFDHSILMADPCVHKTDFLTASEESLQNIHIPLQYTVLETGTLHGLAFWFDVAFLGLSSHVYLCTGPKDPLTHWHQVRCVFPNSVSVEAGQKLGGSVAMHANQRQSYDVEMEITLDDTDVRCNGVFDMKNAVFSNLHQRSGGL